MHGQDGPGHDASQGSVSAARRFGKPAEDVEDVRLRSRLYSATSRPALLTYPRPPRRAPCGRDRHLVRGASAIGRDRLTTEERLSDIVEILAHGLLWLDVLRDYHGSIRSHNFRRFVTEVPHASTARGASRRSHRYPCNLDMPLGNEGLSARG